MGSSRDQQGSVTNFGLEIGHLVKLVHQCLPVTERELLTTKYLMRSLGNKQLQKHLLTANTPAVASTVHAIESYLAIDNAGRPACKVTRKEVDNNHLEKVVDTLSTQSALLASHAETLVAAMARLEAVEQAFRAPQPTRSYSDVVGQPIKLPGRVSIGYGLASCVEDHS